MEKKKEYSSEAEQVLHDPSMGKSVEVFDRRNLIHGNVIPTVGYADQPYIIDTDDGAWLVAVTTGSAYEGVKGEIVVTMRSKDKGKTWIDRCELEPPDGVEAAYAVLYKTPYGRIYVFYNHNTDDIRSVETAHSGTYYRVDSLGHFVFKYSDDNGKSWSKKRYEIPQRDFEIDLQNHHKGKLKYFWNVGKPFDLNGEVFVSLHKIGEFGFPGGFVKSEGVLLNSPNLMTERDPEKIVWRTLPEGIIGIRAPENAGTVAEEQSYVTLSDGTIYCIYRTVSGHPGNVVSRDAGRSFSKPDFLKYANGKLVKHPRAANFVWKCKNGKYIYWFHNNGSKGYANRNPVWCLGGEEFDTPQGKIIRWSQPDVLLYEDDSILMMSYPDMIEADGGYYISETQKNVARTHFFPADFFENIWSQFHDAKRAEKPVLSCAAGKHAMFKFEEFYKRNPAVTAGGWVPQRNGITLLIEYENLHDGDVLFDTLTPARTGLKLSFVKNNFVLYGSDGKTQMLADTMENFIDGKKGHIAVAMDGGANIVYFVYNGEFCDGGEQREFGWQRFSKYLQNVNGGNEVRVGRGVTNCRVFDRALTVAEIVKDHNAFCAEKDNG